MNKPFSTFSLAMYPEGSCTQKYGVNKALYASMDMRGHNGLDLVAPWGTPLMAVEDGTILEVKDDPSGYGKHVRFLSDKSTLNAFREWTYGHCSTTFVKVGQHVTAGQIIANMGNTGFVVSGDNTPFWGTNPDHKGTHLHLGLRLMQKVANGWKYPGSDIGINCLSYNNGFKGSIDPTPYLVGATEANKTEQITALMRVYVGLLAKYKDLITKK
jgi:murein DD-endopeptidase MepM/ murein hydrolase activator NlpD